MDVDGWVTLVAFDTPFVAQMAAHRLDEARIEHRTLSDSAGGNLPHVSFGMGGYRVQVPRGDLARARAAIAEVPAEVMDGLDVGDFPTDPAGEHGVGPPVDGGPAGPAADRSSGTLSSRRWVRAVALTLALLVLWLVLGESPQVLSRLWS